MKINKYVAEETGVHIGDGSMNIYGKRYVYQLASGLEEVSYYHYLSELLKKSYGVETSPKVYPRLNKVVIYLVNKDVVLFKHKVLGLPLGKKRDIKIPDLSKDRIYNHKGQGNWRDRYKIKLAGYKNVERFFRKVGSSNPKHLKRFNALRQLRARRRSS